MRLRRFPSWTTAVCLAFCFALASCSSGGGDDDGTETPAGEQAPLSAGEFRSDCGVVQNGIVANPATGGEPVTVTDILDSTHLVVQRAGGPQLIKLHGVLPPANGETLARSTVGQLAAEPAVLFEVGASCPITGPGGGSGIAGYLFTASGRSYIEEIIKAGVALTIDANDVCAASLVSPCYGALEETYKPKTAGELNDFLWKPRAESAYNHGSLVIHAGPCNATVVVNGETLRDYGPGNGRCNTSRAYKPGCAFGTNVKVEIFDNASGLPYSHDGQPYVIVPNGCSRFEFKR